MGLVIKSPMHAYICKTHFVVDRASELKQNAALTHVLDPSCPHEPPPCQTGSQECASALLVYICLRRLCRHPCTPLQVCNCLPWHMSAHCSKLGWPPSPQRPMFPNMHSASHALIGTDEPVKSQVPGSRHNKPTDNKHNHAPTPPACQCSSAVHTQNARRVSKDGWH